MNLKLANDQETPPSSVLPHGEYLNASTDRLLDVLFSSITSLSNDLKVFSVQMNVRRNSAMDVVQDSLSLASVFIKHCAKSTTVKGWSWVYVG